MNPLPFPAPIDTLRRYGLTPKKSFGQNFIREANVVERIAELLPEGHARVLELGAGLGSLTFALLDRGHQVTAVERDRDLLPVLRELGAPALEAGSLDLLEADAKSLDFAELFEALAARSPTPGPNVLAGNVPYNLTGPLLRKATEFAEHLTQVVFLVQREVVDRLAAAPNSEAYGALSVFAQAAFEVQPRFLVSPRAFYPAPRVESRVVTLRPLHPPRARETPAFRALVKAAFGQRRKTLRNAWGGLYERPRLEAAAARAGIALERRGETLSVDDYRNMSEAV